MTVQSDKWIKKMALEKEEDVFQEDDKILGINFDQ